MNPSAAANLIKKFFGVGYNHGATTVAADTLVIPVTHEYVTKNIGADAEALTLADGQFEGQPLTIVTNTAAGGRAALTPTTKTGYTTIYLQRSGERLRLRWVNATIGWVIEEHFKPVALGAAVAYSTTGSSDAIPTTHEVVELTTTGAHNCSLGDGVYTNQLLRIRLVADGGTSVITPDSSSDAWNSVSMADAQDVIDLIWTGSVWDILGAWGLLAPPVIS